MKYFKCGIPNCDEYISEDELKKVIYEEKIIYICMFCDDENYKEVTSGDNYDSFKKIEKFKRRKKVDE